MTSQDGPRRAAIYVRISKDAEGKQGAGLGVQRQEDDCRKKAAELGWTVDAVYSDNDTSAYSGKPRKAYLRMLDDIRSGRINAVICWHTDRLHRRSAELVRYIDVVEPRGVPTESAKSGRLDLATATGRLVARMLGNISEYEVEHMSERHKAAKVQARAAGRTSGAAAPFGYRKVGKTGLAIHPQEAAALVVCYQMVLAGETLTSVARWLNQQGFRTPPRKNGGGSSLYDQGRVRDTLLRASRAGLIEHDGEIVGPASWEPIVDRATWESVRAILSDPNRRTTTGPKPRWLLSGHDSPMTCAVCGGTWFQAKLGPPSRNPENKARRYAYRCYAGHVGRDAERTDALVGAAVVELLSQPGSASALRPGVDVGALNARRAVIRTQLNALAADGRLDLEQVGIRSVPLRDELARIDEQLTSSLDGSALDGIAGQPDAADIWWSHSVARRKAIVKAAVTVTVLPSHPAKGHPIGTTWFDPESVVIEPRW